MSFNRRHFLQQLTGLAAGFGAVSAGLANTDSHPISGEAVSHSNPGFDPAAAGKLFFKISLAQWSLHKTLWAKKLDNLDFPLVAKRDFGISTVEYVNQFFKDKAKDPKYLAELLKRSKDAGVKNHLIMIDGEGSLGAPDKKERLEAVQKHHPWVDAAKYLGCSTIRVNAHGEGSPEEVQKAAIEGLSLLGDYGRKAGINIIVENHGGITSNGAWLAGVMKGVNKSNVGTLPDFGNFCIRHADGKCAEEYDRYKGVEELMPYAKGVSAKANDFDQSGNTDTDYRRMLQIVKNAGFKGYIGIEYEGYNLSEEEGIRKTKELLEKVGAELA
ncbi:MAG: sugar phosphate isomerase/epimerase [Candidatus Pseudobacter hemicellulosilyticus]|uniref:Sugar phosphate isomerase/epimerase n=1 Tax=Candidatus Pseudobacter hemicellulosilyticus TaxID=3121375 RepID=A0AAJ5WWL0_9BACT|nr:MAG: sugar phosphate isomerase/epimerase [Pseudobacter sp.]